MLPAEDVQKLLPLWKKYNNKFQVKLTTNTWNGWTDVVYVITILIKITHQKQCKGSIVYPATWLISTWFTMHIHLCQQTVVKHKRNVSFQCQPSEMHLFILVSDVEITYRNVTHSCFRCGDYLQKCYQHHNIILISTIHTAQHIRSLELFHETCYILLTNPYNM